MSTAGTIKHRKQTALANNASRDVSANAWNDSEVLTGGTNGDNLVRDSNNTDGWGWSSGTGMDVMAYGAVGNGSTDDTSAFAAAITALGSSGGTLVLPRGTYKLTSALTVSNNSISIVGVGRGSIISVAHTGNVFNVSGQDFVLRDLGITLVHGSSRTGNLVINPTAILGKVSNVTVLGSASFNNGGFAGHLASTAGAWTYEHIRWIGGTTWDYLLKTKSASGTVAGMVIADLIAFLTTFADAGVIFDTLTDTVKMSQCQIGGATAAPAIHIRNTGAGQAPRWIDMLDVSTETNLLGPCLKVDDGRDVLYLGGYFASALNAVVLAGGTEISIAHNVITNIQQHGITIASGVTNAAIHTNTFDDGAGLATTNTYDCINIANSTTNFDTSGNKFRQPSANKPRYAINISGSGCGFFDVIGNDTTGVAWGTAALNNASTSLVQHIWSNPGIASVLKDSAGATNLGALVSVDTPGSVSALNATAIPTGGTAGSGLKVSSTTNFGVFFGSGAPTLSAAKGSLYLRSDGTTTNDRAYINTNGSTTWTALTTVA